MLWVLSRDRRAARVMLLIPKSILFHKSGKLGAPTPHHFLAAAPGFSKRGPGEAIAGSATSRISRAAVCSARSGLRLCAIPAPSPSGSPRPCARWPDLFSAPSGGGCSKPGGPGGGGQPRLQPRRWRCYRACKDKSNLCSIRKIPRTTWAALQCVGNSVHPGGPRCTTMGKGAESMGKAVEAEEFRWDFEHKCLSVEGTVERVAFHVVSCPCAWMFGVAGFR